MIDIFVEILDRFFLLLFFDLLPVFEIVNAAVPHSGSRIATALHLTQL